MPVRHRLVQLLGVLGVRFLFLGTPVALLQAAGRDALVLGVGGIRLEDANGGIQAADHRWNLHVRTSTRYHEDLLRRL